MAKFTKMSTEEVNSLKSRKPGQSEREKTRQQYIEYLKSFTPGDWVSVDLEEAEKAQTVRNRLKSAAKEIGYDLKFIRTKNGIRFEIQKTA
jgi:ribosomal protein L21E